jgi:hypothetical protein
VEDVAGFGVDLAVQTQDGADYGEIDVRVWARSEGDVCELGTNDGALCSKGGAPRRARDVTLGHSVRGCVGVAFVSSSLYLESSEAFGQGGGGSPRSSDESRV